MILIPRAVCNRHQLALRQSAFTGAFRSIHNHELRDGSNLRRPSKVARFYLAPPCFLSVPEGSFLPPSSFIMLLNVSSVNGLVRPFFTDALYPRIAA